MQPHTLFYVSSVPCTLFWDPSASHSKSNWNQVGFSKAEGSAKMLYRAVRCPIKNCHIAYYLYPIPWLSLSWTPRDSFVLWFLHNKLTKRSKMDLPDSWKTVWPNTGMSYSLTGPCLLYNSVVVKNLHERRTKQARGRVGQSSGSSSNFPIPTAEKIGVLGNLKFFYRLLFPSLA